MNLAEKGRILRLNENANWEPLLYPSNRNSSTSIRLQEATLARTQFFPPAHGNSSYLRLTVRQDNSEHVVILPFEDEKIAERFNAKLLLQLGEPLEAIGSVEVSPTEG